MMSGWETIIPGTIVAAVGAAVGGLITRQRQTALYEERLTSVAARIRELDEELKSATCEIDRLLDIESSYNYAKDALQGSSLVRHYYSPVALVGPKSVGKTSLLLAMRSPASRMLTEPTFEVRAPSDVPVHDCELSDEAHFAMPDLRVRTKGHLYLRIHDFPGELSYQKKTQEVIRSEVNELRKSRANSSGVVLICMFDASEAHDGIKSETDRYYNGELFASLKHFVSEDVVPLQRLVLVFNKFDLLRNKRPKESSSSLVKLCVDAFNEVCRPLHRSISPEKVCEIPTILDREDITHNNMGASLVLGECSRGLIAEVAGELEAHRIIPKRATTLSARHFQPV